MEINASKFLAKFEQGGTFDCWPWLGTHDRSGYGIHGNYQNRYAHRVAYRFFVGEIPDGLEVDHLCRNRGCVNPTHLQLVTHGENQQRRRGELCIVCGGPRDRTHLERGFWRCRNCYNAYHREYSRQWRARRRAA